MDCIDLSWSPDGQYLAYIKINDGNANPVQFIVQDLKTGEEQIYDFQITLPRWKKTKGKKIFSWRMELHFNQKTKMVATRGSVKENATCILPVEGTELVPSYGDPLLVNPKKIKKKKY